MKRYLLLVFPMLLLGTIAGHPQTYAPFDHAPPREDFGGPPDDPAMPRRMICVVEPRFPFQHHRCATPTGYPGSPCRCSTSHFSGRRDFVD